MASQCVVRAASGLTAVKVSFRRQQQQQQQQRSGSSRRAPLATPCRAAAPYATSGNSDDALANARAAMARIQGGGSPSSSGGGSGAVYKTKNGGGIGDVLENMGDFDGPGEFNYDDLSLLDNGDVVETVQLVKVRFQIKRAVNFGEVMRLVGGHESTGSWSLKNSMVLKWTAEDNWISGDVELPVDGVFIYKYVVTETADATKPIEWQQGNNQVLTLSPADHPLVLVHDNWKGDPSLAFTSKADGTNKVQTETRLVARIGDSDRELNKAKGRINELGREVRHAQLQAGALREEARLGANVRVALREQLKAEKKRSEVLEEQVGAWKNK
eukprot:CAMPEP_0197600948 /NCGR_PEP_ID=MMETSP1326-20131121/34342_1 /TAXON_ID=1155430 /ORGANISM="Genus nov. species nov., Strain RCC2288" /LENGTH=327 /DNA_ID=CAMNT_0043168099 /DNA_START=50 /DNA_END=1030 /DNA_ORIENTATION=-